MASDIHYKAEISRLGRGWVRVEVTRDQWLGTSSAYRCWACFPSVTVDLKSSLWDLEAAWKTRKKRHGFLHFSNDSCFELNMLS